tara:strand:+ start:119 stop:304 length:186 start_codon:yes stop_codon:yes gene_type:complete
MAKTKKETINITSKSGDVFVQYLRTYSHLNLEGKKMAEEQINQYGINYDFMSNLLSTTIKK